MPSVSINGQPIPFPAPSKNHVSRHRRVNCAHLAEMSLSKARKVLRRENLSQGILWPVPFRGTPMSTPWASLPIVRPGNSRLDSKHGRVEPIDQLAQYHAQFNTPTEWHRQFCSGETRFDRYAVHPERLTFWFRGAKEAVMPGGVLVFSCSRRSRPHTLVSRPPRI